MRAISIRQPLAWAIVHGPKRIENRSRNIVGAYRGPVLIHASKVIGDDWFAARAVVERRTGLASLPASAITRGGIVGRANIVAVFDPCSEDEYRSIVTLRQPHHETDLRWAEPGMWWILLADVEPLPFVPMRGRLGLFDVPDDCAEHAR